MKSVADLAREAGLSPLVTRNEVAFARFLALHKAEVIKELCAGEEPVAWRTFDGEGGYYFRDFGMNENYQSEWNSRNQKHAGWVDALYPAPTVAALKARVAELENDEARLIGQSITQQRLLREAVQQVERWQQKYGINTDITGWLPPAGGVSLLEDIDEALRSKK